ncbi:hypothetical protein HHL11_07095 [Ramlibacter sp. G-1-2-2]|uniref:Uncharacterized protein n=1 Tax=Ramlibacter agri TaxID=2728837 RepID=A0A848H752_9BURK|nr:hypothetical protein [Ramlibacter agri]NML43508.1 hypothetical protein [Ramlibacter agri]
MNTTLPAGYELPAELLAHQKTLDELITKAKKTRAAIDETAAQIPLLDVEAQELTAKLAVTDADRCTAEDSEVKALDAAIKKLAEALDSKQRALARAKNVLIVHEARAPEHDEAVQAAVIVLQNDLIAFGNGVMEQARAELLEKVKPLQGLFAALRTIGATGEARAVREFVEAAYVPDPKGFSNSVGYERRFGTNLLAEQPDPEHAQLAAHLSAALAPIRASLAAGKALGTFVPLDRRPRPYIRRGDSPGELTRAGNAARIAAQGQVAPSEITSSAPQASGFTRKHRADGTSIDAEESRISSLVRRLA